VPVRGEEYDARFARFAAEGQYLHGEADLVSAFVGPPPRRILDAGCGTGRVAIELAGRGYDVLGVEVDPAMLGTARAKEPALGWLLADLATMAPVAPEFDLVVAAGNVMIFLQLGSEAAVIANLAAALVEGGLLVAGFQLGRQLPLARYDALCEANALVLVDRFATWERDPFAGGDYAVSVHRRAGTP